MIQVNKISQLHDGKNIIFCKTDWVVKEFSYIASLPNDVILVTGNSDYCITDDLVSAAPKNIKKWFCQNRLSDNTLLESIPIGIENTVACKRDGHGYVWDHAHEKNTILGSSLVDSPTTKFLYSNFNVSTNLNHRIPIRQISQNNDHITWAEPSQSYMKFVEDILEHEGVVCAQGNDRGDNHRIYETLYLNRIALTFNVEQHKYIHHLYPTVLIEDLNELSDIKNLKSRISEARNKDVGEYLKNDYWLEKIYDEAKKHSIIR